LPVDSFAPNAWGLHHVHGNVRELVEDCYHDNYDGAPIDGSAWISGACDSRVARGGSWEFPPQHIRSAARDVVGEEGERSKQNGFRVVMTLPQ
jgi:formylglycine-generating enzyme required for sulfatase activity